MNYRKCLQFIHVGFVCIFNEMVVNIVELAVSYAPENAEMQVLQTILHRPNCRS